MVAADGSGQTIVGWPGSDDDGNPEWSPDGCPPERHAHDGPGVEAIDAYEGYLLDPDGADRQRIDAPPFSGSWGGLVFSPDGSRVIGSASAVDTTDGRPGDINVCITLDGSAEPIMVPATGFSLASWQPVVPPCRRRRRPLESPSP